MLYTRANKLFSIFLMLFSVMSSLSKLVSRKVGDAVRFVMRNVNFMISKRIFKFGRIPSGVLANVL